MLAVQQIGTSYYLRDTERPDLCFPMTYPQYQTLMDYDEGRVSAPDLWRRLNYYNRMAEHAPCPFCEQGTLPRSTIHYLLMADPQDAHSLHDALIHGQEAGR